MNKFFNKLNQSGQNDGVLKNEEAPELKQPVRNLESSSEISNIVESPDALDVSGRTLSSDLEKVRKLQDEQGEMTLENFEALTGMNPAEFIQYATGNEQIKEADLQDFNQTLKESLANLAASRENPNKSWSQKIKSGLRSQTGRMVFMSLLLFLKFAPQAQAAPGELKVIDPEDSKKIEMSSKSIDKSNVYEVPSDSFDGDPSLSEKIENLAKLDLTNSYETDKADIAEADQVNIQSQVENFLAKINPSNFNDLMDHVWEIAGSSDERPTNNWEGQNHKLTIARIAAAEEIIKNTIDNHDFTSSGLSADQIKSIQDKDFNYKIPASSNGPEQGVTYITDLENPETPGEKFSPEQAKSLKETNPVEYRKLLDKCRYIKVNLLASAENQENITTDSEITVEDLNVEKNIEIWVNNFSNYKEVMVLLDNSPSMKGDKNMMADKMAESDNVETEVRIAYFSDKLHEVGKEDNIQEAAKYLKTVPNTGSSYERMVDAMIEAVKTFESTDGDHKSEERRLLIAGTDEAFQNVNQAKIIELQKLAAEKGVEINILLAQKGPNGARTHSNATLDNLVDGFEVYYEKLKVSLEKRLILNNKIINNPKKSNRDIRKAKESLFNISEKLKNLDNYRFTVKDIALDNGKKINLPIY